MRLTRIALVAGVTAVLSLAPIPAGAVAGNLGGSVSWPMLGFGPARNANNASETTISLGNVAGLRTHWETAFSTSTTMGSSSPVVADGRVYIGTTNGREQAYNFTTGRRAWSRTIGGRPTPGAVANGVLYVGDNSGDVFAINDRTGVVQWEFRSGSSVGAESAPGLAGGIVFIGVDTGIGPPSGTFYALNASNGAVVWSENETNQLRYTAPTVWQSSVFFSTADGVLHARVAATGQIMWENSSRDCFGPLGTTMPAAAGIVYGGSCNSTVFAFRTTDGSVAWANHYSTNQETVGGIARASSGTLFVTDTLRVTALNGTTGVTIWSELSNCDPTGLPSYANGVLYVACSSLTSAGESTEVINPSNGAIVAHLKGYFATAPAITGGQLITTDSNHVVAMGT